MAVQKTRVNLTLPDEVIAVLDRMGKVTGAGRATIVREWLIEATPQMAKMADALEAAAANNVDAFRIMEKAIREATAQGDQLTLDIARDRRRAMRKRPK